MAVTRANKNIRRLTASRLRERRKREGHSRKGAKAGDEVARQKRPALRKSKKFGVHRKKTAAVQTNEVLTTINSFCMCVFVTRC